MSSDERKLLNYLFLAAESHCKKQIPGRDRFLILAMIAACEIGFLELAERCRELIVQSSPHHLLNRYSDSEEAMQSEDFQVFGKQVSRFCTTERAEQLAVGLGFNAEQELQKYQGDILQLVQKLLERMGQR